jgi:antirestriction protein ArdC
MGFSKATNEEAKVILEALEATSPVKITRVTDFNSSSGSYYVPSAEFINLPPSSLFRNVIEEISTLAHEIAHSWGIAAV